MTPYDHDAVINAALAALQTGNSSEATRLAKQATEKKPGDAEGWSILGLSLPRPDGLSYLQKACDMEPSEPRWALHLGQGLAASRDHENAQVAFARAAQLSRGHPNIMSIWGDCLYQLGRYPEAANVFRKVLQVQPSSQLWIKAGDALIGANDTINAVKAYERAHKAGERPFEMSEKLAELHLLLNQYETAEAFIHEALRTNPNDPDGGLRLANLHRWRGKHDEALKVQRQFWTSNTDHAGLISALLDDKDTAVLDTAILLANDSSRQLKDRRRVSFALARFFDRQKDEKQAWAYAEQANMLYDDGVIYDEGLEHKKQLEQALKAYSKLPNPPTASKRMIYIAGPPRCGGSLLQTILSRTPGAASVGERGALLGWVLPKLGDVAALSQIAPQLSEPDFAGMEKAAGSADVYIDKTSPHIIILGLLAKIHAGSRFVVPYRNSGDMIVSMFFHDFPEQFAYTRSVEGIQAYLAFQEMAVKAWRGAGLDIVDHDHDLFVQDPLTHAKALFETLELSWSEDVLQTSQSDSVVRTFSARQVRGVVSQKFAGRGQRYADFIRRQSQ